MARLLVLPSRKAVDYMKIPSSSCRTVTLGFPLVIVLFLLVPFDLRSNLWKQVYSGAFAGHLAVTGTYTVGIGGVRCMQMYVGIFELYLIHD